MPFSSLWAAAVASTFLAACWATPTDKRYREQSAAATQRAERDQLQRRAAFDLDCPNVELVAVDETSTGATGCGRRIRYVKQCRARSCAWLRDGEVLETQVGTPLIAGDGGL